MFQNTKLVYMSPDWGLKVRVYSIFLSTSIWMMMTWTGTCSLRT